MANKCLENKMTRLKIPVPPAPILEQAVGYRNVRDARFLALWWEPCGDEFMVSDGFETFTGNWRGYQAYVLHKAVISQLKAYNLGSSDDTAEYRLVIDLRDRKAFIAPCKEADTLLTSQWQLGTVQEKPVLLSSEDLEKLIERFLGPIQPVPTMNELMRLMEEDRKSVETLRQFLDEQMK